VFLFFIVYLNTYSLQHSVTNRFEAITFSTNIQIAEPPRLHFITSAIACFMQNKPEK